MKIHSKIKNGLPELSVLQQEHLRKYEDKWVIIEPPKNIRTLNQNNFYWLYLGMIESETGNLATDLHEYYKRILLPPKYIKINDKEIKIPSSTTDLSKNDFGEYMDKISADCGVEIPNPCENGYFCGKKSCITCNSKL